MQQISMKKPQDFMGKIAEEKVDVFIKYFSSVFTSDSNRIPEYKQQLY